jgi:hypothetical protein
MPPYITSDEDVQAIAKAIAAATTATATP